MRLRAGYDFGINDNQQTAKLGVGLRSTVDSSGGRPKQDGFSVRPIHRGNGDGTANLMMYMYTAATTEFGDDIDTGHQLIPGDWFQVYYTVAMNSGSNNNGLLQVWINNEQKINLSNILYISSGTPNIDGASFTNFFGGNSSDWRPANTSFAEFKDIFYKIG